MAKWLVLATILALPLYVVRFSILGIPMSVVEVLAGLSVLVVFTGIARQEFRIQKSQFSIGRATRTYFLLLTSYFLKLWHSYRLETIGFFLLVAGLLLSTAVNNVWREGLGALKGWILAPALFALATSASIKYQVLSIKYIWTAVAASGTWLSLLALGYAAVSNLTYDGRLRAFYDSPNELGMYVALTTTATLWLWRKSELRSKKSVLFFCSAFICQLAALLLTQSQGSMLSAAAGALTVVLQPAILKLRTTHYALLTTTFMAIYILGNVLLTTQLRNFIPPDSRSSLASRALIRRAGWDIGLDNWLWGIGPRQFQQKYLEYQPQYPPYLEWSAPQPHNLLLGIWLQAGLLGILGIIMLFRRQMLLPTILILVFLGFTDTPLLGSLIYLTALQGLSLRRPLLHRRLDLD